MSNITSAGNIKVSPPLYLAPMAGITHSAFRRLLADFGGYEALYTEMVSVRSIPHEFSNSTPFVKRRPCEGKVIYQLTLNGEESPQPAIDTLKANGVNCIDINLGCPAPVIKRQRAGKALFDDFQRLERTLHMYRDAWKGTLTVKCRLGDETDGWEEQFTRRLDLFSQCGIDGVCVHPRFSGDKLKRPARLKLMSWIRSLTKLPLIANGDIGPVECNDLLAGGQVDGVMIGRMAIIKPWIFSFISQGSVDISYKEVWERFYNYVLEDFPPEKAIGRIKEFSFWYAKNFFFGHEFFRHTHTSTDLESLHNRALAFLDTNPTLEKSVC